MRQVLINEGCKERPNAQALGAFNAAYSQFIKIAKTSKDGADFVSKARTIKNVPQTVANKFHRAYGKGDVSMNEAGQRFVNKYKK